MEVRREHGCFMEAMRVCLATIRDRIRQRRTRQRTKNYRICRNLAMTKIDSEKGRKGKNFLNSGLNVRVNKPNHAAKVAPTNVDTAQGRRQEEDGAPGILQDRMKASLRAFQERRKPYWVLHREKNMEHINKVSQSREDLQPGATEKVEDAVTGDDLLSDEPASWVVANGEMWQKMAQDGAVCQMPIMDSDTGSSYPVPVEGSLDTQAGEDVQPDEPASWFMAYGQMWQKMAQQDGPVVSKMAIMNSDACSSHPVAGEGSLDTQGTDDLQPDKPASWVVANAQMWQKMTEDGPVVYTLPIMNFEGFLVTQAGEELQADDQDFQSDEPASWFMAYGQMWQKMAQQDGPVVSKTAIMNSDACSIHPVAGEGSLDTQGTDDLQPDEPASWVVANAQMWQKMTEDGPVVYTLPIMNFEGFLVTQAGEELQADDQDFQSDEPASWVVANDLMKYQNMA